MTDNRFLFKLFTVLTVLAYSAMQTVPAFADDGVPPASESQPVVDSQPEGPTTPEEVISQLPEGTNVVVVGESGDSLPLATQQAADGFVEGDPMWCPAGVAPKAGVGGCSPSFTSFNDDGSADTGLIAWLAAANINKAGTIWVASNYAPVGVGGEGGEIILDPTSTVDLTMGNFALTIQGGWLNNINGSKALDTADPYSYFTSNLSISNWVGAVTINNIIFDGVHTDVGDGTQTGLFVGTKGNITLNDVTVRDSYNDNDSQTNFTMTGALLYNLSGTGNIIINNSDFSGNEGMGLNVHTNGTITTNGLTASSNGEYGAYFTNDYTQGKAVTLKGFKQFNNNGWSGLQVSSAGAISISNLIANGNGGAGGHGVYLTNTHSIAGLGVTLTGTSFATNNAMTGFTILSNGIITASNLNASGNGQSGAILDNCEEFSGCDVAKGKMVKLSGVNVFNGNGVAGVPNDQDGLVIKSYGAISISNLMASNNYGDGASLDNEWYNLNNVDSTGTIAITGYGIFQNNGFRGANIYSYGNAVLNNIDASGNGEEGLYMEVHKTAGGSSITINGVNNFSNNGQNGGSGLSGLELSANGTITLNNVTAIGNAFGSGVYLENLYYPLKPYNVILKGTNKFNENGEAGLNVASFGTIQINNLMANGNTGEGGAILDNCIGLFDCATLSPKAVTITGYAITSNNSGGMGLAINSYGAITLNNVTAEGNGAAGTVLQNDYNFVGQAITLKGSNTFNNNDGEFGLGVFTQGAITANNITAIGNDGLGAVLINCNCGPGVSVKNVTLTGVNTFIGNGMDGLWVEASGSVVLSRVTASGNDPDLDDDGVGIYVIADGNITLTCAFTTNNYGGGYYLDALGKITLNGIYSNNPGAVTTDTAISPSVTIKPCVSP